MVTQSMNKSIMLNVKLVIDVCVLHAKKDERPKNILYQKIIEVDNTGVAVIDANAYKPYAQYVLGTQKRLNLTHNLVWEARGTQTFRTE